MHSTVVVFTLHSFYFRLLMVLYRVLSSSPNKPANALQSTLLNMQETIREPVLQLFIRRISCKYILAQVKSFVIVKLLETTFFSFFHLGACQMDFSYENVERPLKSTKM